MIGGTAVALLVPLAIVAAAVGIGLGGGFGGLGSLGQAFNGPEVPGVEPASARAGGDDGNGPGELIADAGPAATATPAAARTGTSATRRRTAARRRRARRGNGDGNRPAATPTPDSQQPSPSSTPQPQPQPTPTQEPPSTVRQVGEQVKQVTNQVPIAGEPAGEVIDTIVETAEQLPLP